MPFVWLALVAVGLTCYVFYPLFFPPGVGPLNAQSEEFFFEANEAAGAPVLVLSLWLFYRRSHYRDLLLGRGEVLFGSLVVGLAAALYGWGQFTRADDLQLASVIPLLFGVALCMGGRPAVRAYWVPILFLGFALPLPPVLLSAVMFPIQLATAEYAGAILNFIGVKSTISGDQILRPENRFIVIETCSGIRTIVTLSMLTVLLIDLFERRGRHAFVLMLLAPVVAFLTNGFRVVSLVLNPHSSVASIHNLQGIIMLLVGLTGIYAIDLLLERVLGSAPPSEATEVSAEDAGDAGFRIDRADDRSLMARTGGVTVVLVVMIAMGQTIPRHPVQTHIAEHPNALLVRVFGEETSREIPPDFQFRGSLRYLAHAHRRIAFEGKAIEVFLGVANEVIRSHTVFSKRLAWPASGFAPVEESFEELGAVDGDGSAVKARRMVLRRGSRSVLSYSFYIGSRGTVHEWLRQAAALDRSPLARDEHVLALRLSAPIARTDQGLAQAEDVIRAAWKRLAPELDGYAPIEGPPE